MEPWLGPDAGGGLDELVEHLTGDGRCPLCAERFARENIHVVRGNRVILSVQCQCCGAGSLITAPAPQHFVSSQPLNADDVLEMHDFLQHFQGDLAGLWSGG